MGEIFRINGALADNHEPVPHPDHYGADAPHPPIEMNGSAARYHAPPDEFDDFDDYDDPGEGDPAPSQGGEMDDDIPEDVLDEIAARMADQSRTPFKIIDADELLSTVAPAREWLVPHLIPMGDVTLVAGDGGTGKSTLGLQLATACIWGGRWLDRETKCRPALYLSAEDDARELHYRLARIAQHQAARSLAGLTLIDLAGNDAVLARFDRDGTLRATPLFEMIERLGAEIGIGCLILDAAADVFGGDENNRSQVRAFIRVLRGLALRLNAAIVLIAHPSVDGLRSGRGYSGSTHWNNGVRSRLSLSEAPSGDGEASDPDLRILTLAKANRARRGAQIEVRWDDGRFVLNGGATASPDGLSASRLAAATDDELFLALLTKLTAQGRPVSPNRSPSYAPTVFAKHPDAGGVSKARFERAMERLFGAKKIRVDQSGPASRRYSCIALIVEGGDAGE
jgi:RecA-family ATPase